MNPKKFRFTGVYSLDRKRIATKSIVSGRSLSETIEEIGGAEYRVWDPNKSKAAASIMKGIGEFPVKKSGKMLYLGAAHGYTPSFFSDIIGDDGIIYAVEFSDSVVQDLIRVSEKRKNIVPILADARRPEEYSWIENVDIVFCDIAQPDQTEIAVRNCLAYLKKGGYLMLSIKSRSIDVTKNPSEIITREIDKLPGLGFRVLDRKELEPYEIDHGFVVAVME